MKSKIKQWLIENQDHIPNWAIKLIFKILNLKEQ